MATGYWLFLNSHHSTGTGDRGGIKGDHAVMEHAFIELIKGETRRRAEKSVPWGYEAPANEQGFNPRISSVR